MRSFVPAATTVLLVLLAGAPQAAAATLAPIGEFDAPTYVTSEPDPERLLVSERLGRIELVDHGAVSELADLSSLVGCPGGGCSGERGLMSVAVAPDFATSGHIYVDYTNNSSGKIHVDELTVSGDTAPLASRRPLLTIPHPDAANHNGGQLQFGPDGFLYASTGDGGGSDDEFHNAQDPESLLGKLLRLDPTQEAPLTPEIWSSGLRNPFRFSFDRMTGDLVIGDVGQGQREEIDFAPRAPGGGVGGEGVNWGWNCREGLIAGKGDDLPPDECTALWEAGAFADPVFDYTHDPPPDGGPHPCAIIGGFVVRDASVGDLYGRYLYGDLCTGELRSLLLLATASGEAEDDRPENLSVANLNSFGEDSCGRVYAVSGDGPVTRLEGPAPASCAPAPPGPEGSEEAGPPSPRPRRVASHLRLTAVGLAGRARRRSHRRGGGRAERLTLLARLTPCPAGDRRRVVFKRGGRRIGAGSLNSRCRAHLGVGIRHRSTFRAVVAGSPARLPGRSHRLVVPLRRR
jgi:Glucose / Sorbosone dehydrogenase